MSHFQDSCAINDIFFYRISNFRLNCIDAEFCQLISHVFFFNICIFIFVSLFSFKYKTHPGFMSIELKWSCFRFFWINITKKLSCSWHALKAQKQLFCVRKAKTSCLVIVSFYGGTPESIPTGNITNCTLVEVHFLLNLPFVLKTKSNNSWTFCIHYTDIQNKFLFALI